jgi:hypothetical protein
MTGRPTRFPNVYMLFLVIRYLSSIPPITMGAFLSSIADLLDTLRVFVWDSGLAVLNLLTPNFREGHVIPKGRPGAGGVWPEYVPPTESDSRCACPALNALANHGKKSRRCVILLTFVQEFFLMMGRTSPSRK